MEFHSGSQNARAIGPSAGVVICLQAVSWRQWGSARLTNQFIILRGELEEKVLTELCHAQGAVLRDIVFQYHTARGRHRSMKT